MLKLNKDIAIHVPDLDKAHDFYGRVLNLKLLERTKEYLVFDLGNLTLYINKDAQVISFIPSFDTKDKEMTKELLKTEGCGISMESEDGFYFTDPFGITMDVVQKKS